MGRAPGGGLEGGWNPVKIAGAKRGSAMGYARRDLQEAFRALEDGRIAFGSWERLFLSAAIDQFRDRNFQLAATSAQRVFIEHQRQPFAGHFAQLKSLAHLRADYEEVALGQRG